MAARRKTRKFVNVIVPKLLPDTKVEVRSLEEGFLGSWHPGTVISGGDSTRNVQYDHLLSDEDTNNITECVKVSSYIDGEDNHECIPMNYRGIIRPFPPTLDLGPWTLHYGQCVDMHHNDAWWEGVIFDHEDGSEERKIFFPDMGDEIKAQVATLRVTQDWDEMLDNWKPRGNWLFLELIEEIEQRWPLLVSVKQIWYEIRLTGSKDIKEWTNADRGSWRKWVSQVWYDNLKIAIKQIINELNSSDVLLEGQHLMEFSDPDLDTILKPGAFSGNPFLIEPVGFPDSPSLEKEVLPLPSTLEPKPSSTNHCPEVICEENGKEAVSPKTKQKIEWLPVSPDMLPEPGLYPDAVFGYSDGQSKKKKLIKKIKGHLLSLNWKIYFNKDNIFRLRYVTPEGVCYYSLREVCRLLKNNSQFLPPLPEDKQRRQSLCSEEGQSSFLCITQSKPRNPCSSDGLITTLKRKSKKQMKRQKIIAKCLKRTKRNGKNLHPHKSRKLYKRVEGPGLEDVDSFTERQVEGSKNPAEHSKTKDLSIRKRKKRKSGVADFSLYRTKCQNVGSQLLTNGLTSQPLIDLRENDHADCSTRVLRSSKRAVQEVIPSLHHSPRNVLSWLIDNNVVVAGEKVNYRVKDSESILIEGYITRDGIRCCCCHYTFSISKFEVHAGSNFRRPAANIFLEDGRSLLNCQLQLEREKISRSLRTKSNDVKRNRKITTSDYICSVCHDGGDLMLCDHCPSAYHKECVGLKVLPEGDWFCPSCCCGVCGDKFDRNTEFASDDRCVSCSQCECRYHFRCVQDKGVMQNKRELDEIWFCNKNCKKGLHQLLGKAVPVGDDDLTWTLVKYGEVEDGNWDDYHHDRSDVTTYGKLSIALSVMHECFLPVKEPLTQSDLIEDMIFCRRSELRRLSFQGFYTVLLEKNGELITTATVRVYGEKLAEVPFVATRFHHRRNGMCRILIDELEKRLMKLGVERLVLPAIETAIDTWTTSFGFSKMTMSDQLNLLSYTFLSFQGAIMCQKLLQKNISSTSSLTKGSRRKFSNTKGASVTHIDGNGADLEVSQADRVEDDEDEL